MKKKFVIVNYILSLAVLFAILFQSIHSYEHIVQQLSEKKCHHKYVSSHEITHKHLNFENCFVCNFTLSSFVSTTISIFEFNRTTIPFGFSFFKSREITQLFKGSLFALRAPPIFIVYYLSDEV